MTSSVHLQLERLRRHYSAAVRTYDKVTLLDLSHALRIWVELKHALADIAPAFRTTLQFKSGLPARKVLKAARGYDHVFCYMPGGVITYAANGDLSQGPVAATGSRNFTTGMALKLGADHLWLGKYCLISRSFDQPLIKALEHETQSRCNFINWLGTEAVRLSYVDDGVRKSVSISREMVVKRVANTLDGSHPSAAGHDADNMFDGPIKRLLEYQVGGLPLPYFILLKMAQDILSIAPKLLGIESAAEAT